MYIRTPQTADQLYHTELYTRIQIAARRLRATPRLPTAMALLALTVAAPIPDAKQIPLSWYGAVW